MELKALFETNVARCNRWHVNGGLKEWSALEWAGAMCGEAGEAANVAKKILRLEHEIASINHDEVKPEMNDRHPAKLERRHFESIQEAQAATAKECADTILYALLLMARVGVTDPEEVIRSVFNVKSIEYGFPDRI